MAYGFHVALPKDALAAWFTGQSRAEIENFAMTSFRGSKAPPMPVAGVATGMGATAVVVVAIVTKSASGKSSYGAKRERARELVLAINRV